MTVKPCCNIDRSGRAFRISLGLLLTVNGIAMAWMGIPDIGILSRLIQAAVIGFGLFAIYEGLVGWCLLRALGVRTRI